MRKFLILMDKTKQKQFSHSSTFQYSRNLQHPNLPVITIFKNVNDDASINNVHVNFFLCILPTLLKLAYLYMIICIFFSQFVRLRWKYSYQDEFEAEIWQLANVTTSLSNEKWSVNLERQWNVSPKTIPIQNFRNSMIIITAYIASFWQGRTHS